MSRPDISEVAQALNGRVEILAAELLPRGRKDGHEWRVGSLAGEPGQSLAVHIGPAKPGVWKDFASGEGGDALDLVAAVLFGGDKKQALAWSISWLGLDDADPARLRQVRRKAKADTERRERESRADRAKKRRHAHKMWIEAVPDIRGTMVDAYLTGRGIDLTRLANMPGAMRFGPAVREPSTGRDMPALLTAITGHGGGFAAVHRTFLQWKDGSGCVKAAVPEPKMVLGRFKGGCIRLWRGERVNPKTGEIHRGRRWGDMKEPEMLAIVEGIEDGLTLAIAKPELKIAVAVSLGHMADMKLPDLFTKILIVADNDGPDNKEAAAAMEKVIMNFQKQRRKVLIARPPQGVKDVNDMVKS